MLTLSVHVRLLDADGRVVCWAPLRAEARGDQGLWAVDPFPEVPTRAVAWCVVHQPDLHVAVWTPCALPAGSAVVFTEPLIRFATDPRPLPPVVVTTPLVIAPRPARMGTVGAG